MPQRVVDQATFEDPMRFPLGIEHVLTAGTQVVNAAASRPAPPRPGGQEIKRTAVADVFEELIRLRREGRACALATVVRTAGSTPRKSAARMIVLEGGEIVGTIGGGRIEKEVIDQPRRAPRRRRRRPGRLLRYHLTHELAMCCGGEMEVFVEPLVPEPPLIVCGGGHVARAVVPLARSVGFSPIVVDDLDELASRERFPDAARLIDSFDVRDWQDVPLDDHTYAIIVTRDHAIDQALLEQLIGHRPRLPRDDRLARQDRAVPQRLEAKGVRRGALRRGCARRSASTSAPRHPKRSRSRSRPS